MSNSVLEISNLSVGFAKKELFNVPKACIKNGDFIALLGVNGSGKSTLIRTILGLHKPLSGEIKLNAKRISDYSILERAQYLAAQFTGKQGIPGGFEVKTLISTGRHPYDLGFGKLSLHDEQIITGSAESLGILELLDRKVENLSDGEFQKVMLARALAQDTPFIILDEPFSFLDYPAKKALMAQLKSLAQSGKGILFSTHDLEMVVPETNRFWIFDKSYDKQHVMREMDHVEIYKTGILKKAFNFDPGL